MEGDNPDDLKREIQTLQRRWLTIQQMHIEKYDQLQKEFDDLKKDKLLGDVEMKKKDDECTKIGNRNRDLKSEIAIINMELKNKSEKIASMNESSNVNIEVKQLNDQNVDLLRQLKAAEQKLTKLSNDFDWQKTELGKCNTELQEQIKLYKDLQEKSIPRPNDNTALQEQKEKLRIVTSSLNECEKQKEEGSRNLLDKTKLLEDMKILLKEKTDELETLNKKTLNIDGNVAECTDKWKEEYDLLEQELKKVKELLKVSEEGNKNCEQEFNKFREGHKLCSVATVTVSAARRCEERADDSELPASYEKKLAALRNERDEFEKKVNNSEDEFRAYRATYSKYKNDLSECEAKLVTLTEEIQSGEEHLKQCQQRLDQKSDENKDMEKERNETKLKLSNLQTEYDELKSNLESVNKESEQLKENLETIKKENDELKKCKDDLIKAGSGAEATFKNVNFEEKFHACKKEILSLDKSFQELKSANVTLKEETKILLDKLTRSEQELGEFRKKYGQCKSEALTPTNS